MRELKVTVSKVKGRCGARLEKGDHFFIRGKGKLELPAGQEMCIYALQSVLPFLILRQRDQSQMEDAWIPETVEVCCPDPLGVVFQITEVS